MLKPPPILQMKPLTRVAENDFVQQGRGLVEVAVLYRLCAPAATVTKGTRAGKNQRDTNNTPNPIPLLFLAQPVEDKRESIVWQDLCCGLQLEIEKGCLTGRKRVL